MLLTTNKFTKYYPVLEYDLVIDNIKMMDGINNSELGLYLDDDNYMIIGGGNGSYICSIRHGGVLYTLCDRALVSGETKWIISGQGFDVPEEEIMDVETIIDVVLFYIDNKSPNKKYDWKEY